MAFSIHSAFQGSAFQFTAFQLRRTKGGGYPTEEEIKKYIADEKRYREEKRRRVVKRRQDEEELLTTLEIALLKSKGLWIEPKIEELSLLPPELAEITFKPLDPGLIGELRNLRTMEEENIEILLLAA